MRRRGLRGPPVPLAEQAHQRGDQQGADDVASIITPKAMPIAICLTKKTVLTPKARKTTAIASAAAVITRPVRPMPIATASSLLVAEVVAAP